MIYLTLRFWLILIAALALTILPIPDFLNVARPPWVFFLILYIQFYLSAHFNLTFLFFLGLCMDVLLATVIGSHTFALLLTAWIALGRVRRFEFFSSTQQLVMVGMLCFVYQLSIILIDAFLGFHYTWFTPLISAFMSMILWPWFKLFADCTLLPTVFAPAK